MVRWFARPGEGRAAARVERGQSRETNSLGGFDEDDLGVEENMVVRYHRCSSSHLICDDLVVDNWTADFLLV